MWLTLARIQDLKPDSARAVKAGGLSLALVRTSRGVFAMDNACPHEGGPLGEGTVEGATIACPLHAWRFDCASGACLTEPRQPVRTYPVKLDGDAVLVELPEAAAAAPAASADMAPGQAPAADWHAVAKLADFKPGSVRKAVVAGRALALARTADAVHALDDACAHEGGPLSEGTLDGATLTCPMHGWQFDCASGRCLNTAGKQQLRHETKIEQDQVWVRLAAPAAEAQPAGRSAQFSPVELWKREKHGIDVWPDVLRYAARKTPMAEVDAAELERMKWYGLFHRKTNDYDHYMCRIRIPGCEMTSEQARAIAFIAYRSGYSIVDVTTRGNIQIQGLTVGELPVVRATLESMGLTSRQSGHDNVRNVTCHPYSGIDPEELIDTRPLAREIQDLVVGSREFSDLPRKFNIAMTGRPAASAETWTQDLAFVAAPLSRGEPAFQVLVGGKQGQSPHVARPLPVLVEARHVVGFTAALLRAFRELGQRHNRTEVRLRYLIERIGIEQLLAEVERRLGFALAPSPLGPPRPEREESFVGWFRQKQAGRWALGVCVPVGRLSWDEFEGAALVARDYGSGTLRTTTAQNLVVPDIPEAARASVAYAIGRYGLTFEPDTVTKHTVACTGKQFCNLAVTETKGYASRLIEELRRRKVQLHGISLHMSGCPSSCANSYTADIGLKGTKIRRRLRVVDAFDVYLGGGVGTEVRLGILYKKAVPFDELAYTLEAVVREFYLQRGHGENFAQYWRRVLERHKPQASAAELPVWGCTQCGYRQVSADPPAFCPVCSAIRIKFEPVAPEAEAARAAASAAPPDAGAGAPQNPAPPAPAAAVAGVAGRTQRRIVIVGGSIAGHTAAQAARELDSQAAITLLSDEPGPFYNRLNLTRLLAGEVARDQLFDFPSAWYAERGVALLSGTRAIGLDPLHKTVLTQQGQEVPYDACILAHGSSPAVPGFCRAGMAGVHLLRTLSDVDSIVQGLRPGARAVVVGGGVLGLEAAAGMAKRGARVEVLEQMPRIMPRQLDTAAAELVSAYLAAQGIGVRVGARIAELTGDARVEGVRLADGATVKADLVVVSAGIAPNIDWVKRSGVHCGRGVRVDGRMRTSAPDVFAAGDIVEWRDRLVALWNPAIEQARVAAAGALGRPAEYRDAPAVTILKCLGLPVVSIGDIAEDGPEMSLEVERDEAAGLYRRVAVRDGRAVGAVQVGTLDGMGALRRRVEEGWSPVAQGGAPGPTEVVRAAS